MLEGGRGPPPSRPWDEERVYERDIIERRTRAPPLGRGARWWVSWEVWGDACDVTCFTYFLRHFIFLPGTSSLLYYVYGIILQEGGGRSVSQDGRMGASLPLASPFMFMMMFMICYDSTKCCMYILKLYVILWSCEIYAFTVSRPLHRYYCFLFSYVTCQDWDWACSTPQYQQLAYLLRLRDIDREPHTDSKHINCSCIISSYSHRSRPSTSPSDPSRCDYWMIYLSTSICVHLCLHLPVHCI